MGLENSKTRNTYETALMSDSWPVKVCVARPVRISQSFAAASQAPEMKTLVLPGARDKLKWKLISVILLLKRKQRLPHYIARMVTELDDSYTCLNIPKHASHVS